MSFQPTRDAGLAALADFLPHAGRTYAQERNDDRGPDGGSSVSMLSRYIRHRLVTEREVVAAVLERHSLAASEKFVQEVFWRTYWKGWLELRPEAWSRYRSDLAALLAESDTAPWRDEYAQALAGQTGIDCFDVWVAELAEHGYLHNHTRMWFASIWIFTLKLPWQLGADLFYRQLFDGDAASNTLSWRWVAGLQTKGKTYLARPDNIAQHTDGRFRPRGLATSAPPLTEEPLPSPIELELPEEVPPARVGLLVHEEDLHSESLSLGRATVEAVAGAPLAGGRSPLGVSGAVSTFTRSAVADGLDRAENFFSARRHDIADVSPDALAEWAASAGVTHVVTGFAPVGPVRDALDRAAPPLAAQGIALVRTRRQWDSRAWPLASRGFFAFRERIPSFVRDAGISFR